MTAIKITVTPHTYGTDYIELIEETSYALSGRYVTDISRTVVDLKDQGIRAALIALGWTPPKLPEGAHSMYCIVCCAQPCKCVSDEPCTGT